MPLVRLANETDFEGWRNAARSLLVQGITPEDVKWRISGKSPGLFETPAYVPTQKLDSQLSVPRDFFELCKTAILNRNPIRFDLLYRLLWRIQKEPGLLLSDDSDVVEAKIMAQAVLSDLHNMKASIKFISVHIQENDKLWSGFVAWFEPCHFIVQVSASFFTQRLINMRWSIQTPDICMHWNGKMLSYSPGIRKEEKPGPDAEDKEWRAYHRSVSNPSWLKVPAMQSQVPENHWRHTPEAERVPEFLINVDKRKDAVRSVRSTTPQRKIVNVKTENEQDGMAKLDAIAAKGALHRLNMEMLTNIEFKLAEYSTQFISGSGPAPSDILLLGEHPDEQDDLAGQFFIGPAGKLLDQALQDAGIERSGIYVTNLLKHYKFSLHGMRRVHRKPDVGDVKIYLPWLEGEIDIVQPRVIVALGSLAAHAITGKTFDMEVNSGKLLPLPGGRQVLVTYHPTFILCSSNKATKQLRYEKLVTDLKLVVKIATSTLN